MTGRGCGVPIARIVAMMGGGLDIFVVIGE